MDKGLDMQKDDRQVLIVGAGISGIRSALELAETGRRVLLIDQALHIGGVVSQLDHQFPNDHCGMCRMLPVIDRDAGLQCCLRKDFFHENIEVLTATRLMELNGDPGQFTVRLRQTRHWVDPVLCVGCGLCENVCPVEIPDAFNIGLGTCKAIHRSVPHAVPHGYVIDPVACTRCGACEEICPTQAVQSSVDRRGEFPILVVDDELVIRDSLKEWLVNEGFNAVDMAASGVKALKMLGSREYRLMLTDIKMPGMDGMDLLQQAKAKYPALTVIMMTAYATVETAVEAMKIGAMDYFLKPFDPDIITPLIARIYEQELAAQDMERSVGAVILATGVDYYDPTTGINPFGYGQNPHVITNLQLERILSSCGPTAGRLIRPSDGKAIAKIAWMQCVGSRDIQSQADFCSTICCMAAIKEAMLVKKTAGRAVDTAIYFMDMRTGGKGFGDYQDKAAHEFGVRFIRARVHSISPDPSSGDPVIRVMAMDGTVSEEAVDLVVLSLGQRPVKDTAALAEILGLSLNSWGFLESLPFRTAHTGRPGIFLSGSTAGLRAIGPSLIQASAAALEAGRVLHPETDRSPTHQTPKTKPEPDLNMLKDLPQTLVALCTCSGRLASIDSEDHLTSRLKKDPSVQRIIFTDGLCKADGWRQLQSLTEKPLFNRLLIGACHPLVFQAQGRAMIRQSSLPRQCLEIVDLGHCRLPARAQTVSEDTAAGARPEHVWSSLAMGLSRLRHADPEGLPGIPVIQRALVIGGGIAGMQAALGIADRGYEVDLVEKTDKLGGNLRWLQHTLDGHAVAPFLADTMAAVEKHPLIHCRLNTRVIQSHGRTGVFHTLAESAEVTSSMNDPKAPSQNACINMSHGVTILATGGDEAVTDQYHYGQHRNIVTQKELEKGLASECLDPQSMNSVVMIQCVGSRETPRHYCSRVCCPTALKHALDLKSKKPAISVYILYRDMMTPGFLETHYTRARKAGVIFIQYDPTGKPRVAIKNDNLTVTVHDPVINADLEIETDLLVLATGVSAAPPVTWQGISYATPDKDGFFKEADVKWRPMENTNDGVFACGLSLAPAATEDAVVSGQAAAQRALRILTRTRLPAGITSARVRPSLCTLCRQCIDTCPYGARWIDEEEQLIRINPALCQGCGACAAVCPNGAAVLNGYSKSQVLEMIDGALV